MWWLALILLVVGLGWFNRCCPSGCTCSLCDSTPPSTISLTLGGWDDWTCDCAWLNDTFVLACSTVNSCIWKTSFLEECQTYLVDDNWVTMQAELIDDGSGYAMWRVTIESVLPGLGGGYRSTVIYEYSDSSTTQDCEGQFTLDFVSQSTSAYGPTCSDLANSTCQIN